MLVIGYGFLITEIFGFYFFYPTHSHRFPPIPMGRPPIVFSCPSVTLFLRSFYFFFFYYSESIGQLKKISHHRQRKYLKTQTPTHLKQNETFEMLFGVCAIQTSWCTRRRSTRQSQTIWTRLSQNSRHTRDINNATAPSTTTTTIHFRLDSTRKLYLQLTFLKFYYSPSSCVCFETWCSLSYLVFLNILFPIFSPFILDGTKILIL